jgi:hypothetical protein
MATPMDIPISKGKDLFYIVDLDEIMAEDFPADVYREIIFQGLKQVINRGFSVQESAKKMSEAEQAKHNKTLLSIAEENMNKYRKGEIRVSGGKAKTKGLARAIMTEATRLAKVIVKDGIKRAGKVKVSHVAARKITELAKQYLETEHGKALIDEATATVKGREKAEATPLEGIDLSQIKADPELVAKSKTKNKKPAKEGVVAKAKPQAEHRAAH